LVEREVEVEMVAEAANAANADFIAGRLNEMRIYRHDHKDAFLDIAHSSTTETRNCDCFILNRRTSFLHEYVNVDIPSAIFSGTDWFTKTI